MRLRRIGALGVAIALVAAACGGNGSTDTSPDTTAVDTTTTAAGSAEDMLRQTLDCDVSPTTDELVDYELPTADDSYDITLLQVSLAGYYYQAIDYGAHDAGERAGVEVTTLAAEGYASPDLQLSQVEDAIQRGTDAIVMAPSTLRARSPQSMPPWRPGSRW